MITGQRQRLEAECIMGRFAKTFERNRTLRERVAESDANRSLIAPNLGICRCRLSGSRERFAVNVVDTETVKTKPETGERKVGA